MSDEYLDWLSQYMVMKRASIEMNFHPLYSNFVDQIKKGQLNDLLVKETLRNIEVWFFVSLSLSVPAEENMALFLYHFFSM